MQHFHMIVGYLSTWQRTRDGKSTGKKFAIGTHNDWVRSFERRWSERITRIKNGSIDKHRGKKATEEVRDTVFAKKFQLFCKKLVDDGKFTVEQMKILGDHLCNADDASVCLILWV